MIADVDIKPHPIYGIYGIKPQYCLGLATLYSVVDLHPYMFSTFLICNYALCLIEKRIMVSYV